MITEEQLNSLQTFGRETDGSYSDRWQFAIIKGGHGYKDEWVLYFESEIDGDIWFIKVLKDFEDLKNVYKAITDKELI